MKWVNTCLKQEICRKQETKYATFKNYNLIFCSYQQIVLEKVGLLNLIL